MKFFIALGLFFTLTAKAEECKHVLTSENLCATIEWRHGPKFGEISTFDLRLTDLESGGLADPEQTLFVKTWMQMDNGRHHPGPKLTLTKVDAGFYQVNDARFFGGMKGKWFVLIQILNNNSIQEEVKYEVVFPN